MYRDDCIASYIVDYGGLFLVVSIISSIIEFLVIGRVDGIPFFIGVSIPIIILFYSGRSRYLQHVFRYVCYDGSLRFLFLSTLLFIIYVLLTFLPVSIFPANPSGDFIIYVNTSLKFLEGEASYSSLLVMHPAIYPLLASVISIFQGFTDNPILISRLFMMLIIFYTFPLIYELSGCLYGRWGGETSLVLSFLVNIFWYIVVIGTGLYANLLGIVLSLYLFLLIYRFYEHGGLGTLIFIFIVSSLALISHETSFLFLIALWLSALYGLLVGEKRLFKAAIASVLPLTLLVLASAYDLRVILNFVVNYVFRFKPFTAGAVRIEALDPFADMLGKYSPYLAGVYRYVGWLGLILVLTTLLLGIYLLKGRWKALHLLPWFWLLTIWFFTLFFLDIWRIALYSIYPVCIFLGLLGRYSNVFDDVLSKITGNLGRRRIIKYEILTLLIIIMLSISPIYSLARMSLIESRYDIRRQGAVYDAMVWIRKNTAEDSVIVSVGRWEFMYTSFITGRSFYGDRYNYPDKLYSIISDLLGEHTVYVAVWNRVLDLNNTIPLVDYYREDDRFLEVYHNEEVSIFKVVG